MLPGIAGAAAYGLLAYFSRLDAHPPLSLFFGCLAVCTLAWLYAFRRPPRLRFILLFALAFRVIGFLGSPLYEDDFYRYLWDGYQFGTLGTPYGVKPSEFFADPSLPPRMEEVLGGVNFPDIPTIYGPVCQLSFLLAWFIAPGELWPLKLIFLAVDAAVCAGVWLASRRLDALVAYAWCPLVIKEIAFTAHTDVLAAALLLLAWLLHRQDRSVWAAAIFGVAVAAKVTVLFAAPFLLWRARPRVWLTAAAAIAACYAPFAVQGATELDGLRAFGEGWEFNSFGFAAVKALLGEAGARLAIPGLYAAFCGYVCLRRPAWLRPDILLGAFLFLAPVVNAWYLLLLAPFIALYPSAIGMAALGAVLLSYLTEGRMGTGEGEFNHPLWVRTLQLAAVGGAALWESQRRGKQQRI